MILWVVLAALTAAAAILIVSPFWRRKSQTGDGPHDLAVYKQQLAEIEEEYERGLLDEVAVKSARIEISRRILAASEQIRTAAASKISLRAPYFVVAVLTAISMGLYLIYGSPNLSDQPLTARTAPANEISIEALVARVEERLKSHPEDGTGWSVIAPIYMRMARYSNAAEAYRKANELLGPTPERLGDFGEALTLANNGFVTDQARQAFEQVLAADGNNDRAQFWMGISEEQSGKFTEAADRYRKILAHELPDNVREVVQQRLAQVESRASGSAPSAVDQSDMIDKMVLGLAERLKNDGSDLQGWLKLMRAYTVLGRRDDALNAMKQARGHFAGNQDALGQIEEAAKSLGLTS